MSAADEGAERLAHRGQKEKVLSCDLPEAVHLALRRLALDEGTTVSALQAEGLGEVLRKRGIPVPPELAQTGRKRRGRPPGGGPSS
jgi:hypothetical protein